MSYIQRSEELSLLSLGSGLLHCSVDALSVVSVMVIGPLLLINFKFFI